MPILTPIDADQIIRNLYQGSKPPFGEELSRHKFDVLVLAAQEYQPADLHFPGLRVVRAPMDDARLSSREWDQVVRAARAVASYVRRGKQVLVTCYEGRNRSGIIVAVAVHLITGVSGARAVDIVRRQRKAMSGPALTNPDFVARLRAIRSATLSP